MERPAKRRRVSQAGQFSPDVEVSNMANNLEATRTSSGSNDSRDQQFLHAALSELSRAPLPSVRKASTLLADYGKSKPQRLHPRNFIPYQAAGNVVKPIVQPVQTAVASFINVVLDNGGTSVGNVLVPAESTVFNLNGYGPITIDKHPPPKATPGPQQQNPPPAPPSSATHSHRHSHAPQQTPQPAPQPASLPAPSAAPSQQSPPEQSPMSIQVPGSSSQIVLSSPSTPLPPSPSNSTSSGTESGSYFASTASQTSSSSQTSAASSSSSSQVVGTSSPSSLVSNGGLPSTTGNLTTSAITSYTVISGSTRATIFPTIITPTSNLTSIASSTSSGSFSAPFSPSSQASNTTPFNSTFATATSSSFTTSSSSASASLSSLSSSASASSTDQGGGAVGGIGGPTSTAGAPPSASTTAAAGSGGSSTPSTPTLVGGVVGGVAGLTLILVLLLFFLRRRKRLGQQRNISPPIPQSASTGPGANTGTMTERSSAAIPLAGAGAGAGFFRRLRPGSGATATTTETTPSERGFQNLGGRKLEPMLSGRGDGYGDIPFGTAATGGAPGPSSGRGPPPASIPIITAAPGAAPGHSSPESLSGSSFYRDSQGFYGGPAQPQPGPEPPSNSSSMFVGPGSPSHSPTHPSLGTSPPEQEGVAVTRPGPARTPVITQPGGLSPLRGSPRQPRGTPPPPQIPGTIQERDGLGRSHPSLDGSRGSRFAENI